MNTNVEPNKFEKIASEIINSLRLSNCIDVRSEKESYNTVLKHLEQTDFKTDRSLEIELLDTDSKDNIVNNLDVILKVLCTSQELEDYPSLRNEAFFLWQLKDLFNQHLTRN